MMIAKATKCESLGLGELDRRIVLGAGFQSQARKAMLVRPGSGGSEQAGANTIAPQGTRDDNVVDLSDGMEIVRADGKVTEYFAGFAFTSDDKTVFSGCR
jgi:hypothetical protein